MKKYFALILLAAVLVSCENNDGPKNNTLSIRFNIMAGNTPLLYNVNYMLDTNTIQFTQVRFYMSQPVFSSGAESVAFNDSYYLADAAYVENTWEIGDVGKRTFDGVALGFGVDSSRNTQNGTQAIPAYSYDVNHALSVSNNMYWSWNPGYIWMKLEGRMDANHDGDLDDAGETFGIHTGLDPAYVFVSRTFVFSMNDEPKTINVDVNVLRFFDNYDLLAHPNSHAMSTGSPDYPFMLQVQNNVQNVFGNFYE